MMLNGLGGLLPSAIQRTDLIDPRWVTPGNNTGFVTAQFPQGEPWINETLQGYGAWTDDATGMVMRQDAAGNVTPVQLLLTNGNIGTIVKGVVVDTGIKFVDPFSGGGDILGNIIMAAGLAAFAYVAWVGYGAVGTDALTGAGSIAQGAVGGASSVTSSDLAASIASQLESGSSIEEITAGFQAAGFTDAQIAAGLSQYGTIVNAANIGTIPTTSIPSVPSVPSVPSTTPVSTPGPSGVPWWNSVAPFVPAAGTLIRSVTGNTTPIRTDLLGNPITDPAGNPLSVTGSNWLPIALAVGAVLLLT